MPVENEVRAGDIITFYSDGFSRTYEYEVSNVKGYNITFLDPNTKQNITVDRKHLFIIKIMRPNPLYHPSRSPSRSPSRRSHTSKGQSRRSPIPKYIEIPVSVIRGGRKSRRKMSRTRTKK